jgi:hypothetical protein
MSDPKPKRLNPVFWLMFLLPGLAVAGSLVTVVIAFRHGDTKLPAAYHWEGANLDADFERARRAAAQAMSATLEIRAAENLCVIRFGSGSPATDAVVLLLTHSDDASLDRQIRLRREGDEFQAACDAVPEGKWRIALADDAGTWAIRAHVAGSLARVDLRARHPDGPGA